MEKITPEEVMQMDINSLRNVSRDNQAQVKLLNTLLENRQREIAALRAELAQARQVPEGFVLVPVEPTQAMLNAGYFNDHAANRGIWQAMLAAAQQGAKSHE